MSNTTVATDSTSCIPQDLLDKYNIYTDEKEKSSVVRREITAKMANNSYGFDVQFILQESILPVEEVRARVELVGESVVVVGDSQLMRIHIHTKNRNAVLNFARCTGRLSDLTLIKRVFKKFPNPLYQRGNQGRLNPFYR